MLPLCSCSKEPNQQIWGAHLMMINIHKIIFYFTVIAMHRCETHVLHDVHVVTVKARYRESLDNLEKSHTKKSTNWRILRSMQRTNDAKRYSRSILHHRYPASCINFVTTLRNIKKSGLSRFYLFVSVSGIFILNDSKKVADLIRRRTLACGA